jgi:hypothetical protein
LYSSSVAYRLCKTLTLLMLIDRLILLQLVHTLSVSLNKVGDLRYYDGDLQSARSYYARSLEVRRNSVKEHSAVASQVIQMLRC